MESFSLHGLKPGNSRFAGQLRILLIFSLSLLVTLSSCNKAKQPVQGNSEQFMQTMDYSADSNFVNLHTASQIAKRMTSDVFSKHIYDGSTIRGIDSYYEIPDSSGKPALYVFNYTRDSGYVVIAADYRYQPVCAFVRDGSLLKTDNIPSMLGSWFGRTVENIQMIRAEKYDNTAVAYNEWDWLLNTETTLPNFLPADIGPPYGGGCSGPITSSVTVGPLMQTTWGQRCGYNNLCPASSCDNDPTLCGHYPTGCVATAMAQVIKYWAHPCNYNYVYSSMLNNSGSGETQRLMKDIGNVTNMDYDCDGSGTDGGFGVWLYNYSIIPAIMTMAFDFSHAQDKTYYDGDVIIIRDNIDYGRPVILEGYDDVYICFLWWCWGSNGHVWVCDGYRRDYSICGSSYWLHMNWGWNGSNNGFYYQTNWNIPSENWNFQYQNHLIYNTYP